MPLGMTALETGLKNITFVGFAAQVCLTEYVKFKVSSDPSLAQPTSGSTSILECAIFGWEYFISAKHLGYWSFHANISTSERYSLVEFLLSKGSDQSEVGRNGVCLSEEVRRRPIKIAPFSVNDKQVDYWSAIEELLRRGRRRRFFNQISTRFRSRKSH